MWHRPDSRRNSGSNAVMPCRLIHNNIRKTETISDLRFSAPLGARTLDPNIKSVVLYQLS